MSEANKWPSLYLLTRGMTPAFLAEKVRVLTMWWRPALMSEIVCSKVAQPFVTCSGSSLIKSVNILEFLYFRRCPRLRKRILMIAHWSVKVDQNFETTAKPLTKFVVTCSWIYRTQVQSAVRIQFYIQHFICDDGNQVETRGGSQT